MISFNDLNDRQKEAVVDDASYLRIIAGAGSGKTRVLTMRIAYLILEKHILPKHILAITFTNKAANEMKSRINEMLKDQGAGTFISTIHSLCVRILVEDINSLNYPRNFTICDTNDQHQILKEAYKEIGIDKNTISYSTMLNYIGANKTNDISVSKARELAYLDEYELKKAKVYDYYQKRLEQLFALDFDDLILFTLRIFKQFPNIKEKWAKRFEYVLVDEFQDVDNKQYELIKYLTSVHKHLYVVGDPDQTIYTWRGADVNIIVNFESDFPETKTIILNRNYRSTNNILEGANSLIRNNKMRIDKDLYSEAGDGDKITHMSLDSEDNEAYYVAKEIIMMHKEGIKYKDIAILYRSNYLSRAIEKAFVECKLPYVIYGGLRFYERAEIKDILSYLRLIVTEDDLAFSRVINTPRRGIGNTTIDNLFKLAQENNLSMYQVIKRGLYPKNQATFNSFVNMVERWKMMLEKESLDNLFRAVLDESGYREMLEKDHETERLENVKSLLDDVNNYVENYPETGLEDYLQFISLYTDKANDKDSDAINMLTIHSAKGLEFDYVFVIGLSEGIFPSERSIQENVKGLEEERRLAYVAYTRARKKLYLTDNHQFSYVTQGNKTPSRFIKEIDSAYINDLSKKEKPVTSLFEGSKEFKASTKQNSKVSYKKGDLVSHAVFGDGVVIKLDGNFVSIAFSYPHGTKKLLASHPSLKKKIKA